jgi:SAM-dependent methyltransferase
VTDLRETSLGFYRAWHAGIGARHGLLLALRDAPLAPDVLAVELGLDPRAVELWCRGAWGLDLLARDAEGRYRLRREHRDTLGEPASLAYLGHHFEYLTQKSIGFGALDDLLAGRAPRADLSGTYALATRYDHLAFFEGVLADDAPLRRALARGVDVLDLGAGEGGWTREAMRRFPASRFATADLSRAPRIPGARRLDARKLPAEAFDLVFLGEVLAAAPDPVAPLAAARRALRPGGRLVALEGLLPAEERKPRGWGEALVTAMGLDFALDGSRYLRADEARAALRTAGFPRASVRDLGGSLFSIQARKPQA